VILAGVISITDAFGQIADSITVTTDKTSYEDGETIFVTGEVRELLSGTPVDLRVIAPNGNLVTVARLDVGSDKKFSTELTAGGALMRDEGTYTIVVLYGTESRTAETTFEFGGSIGTASEGTTIQVSGTDFMVNYKITGGKLIRIDPDVDSHSLIIAMTASQDGSLVITLPRSLIDARTGDQDDTFLVSVDGVEFDFEEVTTSTDRTLTIQFPAGSEEIEILAKDSHANQMSDSILVGTDKSKYDENDTILVIGKVREFLSGYPVSLRVLAPNGNLVTVVQVEVNSDNTFSTYLTPTELWKYDGTYTIVVLYGTESRTAETTFTFGDVADDIPTIPDDDLPYEIIITPASGSGAPSCEETSQGCFIPKVASVATGGKVIFSNTDTAAHTFTAGTASEGNSGEFDTGLIMAGSSYEWTATTEGEFPYYCMVHPWMAGIIFVGEGTYIPPQPEDDFDLQVIMGNQVYDLLDTATINFSIDGISTPQNVALEISDPRGTTVISRSFMVDSEGIGFEFRIDENFKTGTYKVVATTPNNGNTVTDTAYFKVKSQYNSFKITSVQVTDQQGNTSNLQKGEMGFIKVNLEANKSITTLVTVNLFDSDLTSIGIGSIKTTLSSGNSEIILSFMIPSDVAVGQADIYVNAFSDWPSNGGIPLTSEVSITENIE
jgi:plastocyanin